MPNGLHRRVRKPRSGSGPTVADVARMAGVSPMTVSRVINSETNVLPTTRDKVHRAIAALGYVPNAAARTLAGGQPCRIALLHSNPSAAYLSEFLMGSLAQASLIDAQLVVERCDSGESSASLVQRIAAHRVDAVLLPPPLCDNGDLLTALHDAGLPIAQVATGRPVAFANALTIGDEIAAHMMAAHLIELGHRRIGFITGDPNQTVSALRRAGYDRALADAGIAPDLALVVQGDFTYRSGLAASEILLSGNSRPTAIFASNDDMAAAAVAIAHRNRLDVPANLSVCGFDDSAMATTIWPELTTIRQPIAEMARQGIALLAVAVRTRSNDADPGVRHIQLDFELVRRASDGRPGAWA